MTSKPFISKPPLFEWAALTLLCVGNALFLKFNFLRFLHFGDAGFVMDASWRLFKGQLACRDFIISIGPVHFYLISIFYSFLGFGKHAILAHLIMVHTLAIMLVFLMARRHLSFLLAFLTACLTMTTFYWSASYPRYNQTADLFGIIGISLLVSMLPFRNKPAALRTGLLLGIAWFLSFMTKHPIGAAFALVYVLVLLSASYRIRSLIGFLAGTLIAALIVRLFLISSYRLFIEQVIINFSSGVAARPFQLLKPENWLLNHEWLIVGLTLIGLIGATRQFFIRELPLLFLFLGLWFISLFSVFTTAFWCSSEVQLLGCFVAVAFILVKRAGESTHRKIFSRLSTALLIAAAIGLTALHAKYGVELMSQRCPPEKRIFGFKAVQKFGDYKLKTKALEGWACEKRIGEALDALVPYMKANVPQSDSLLVLTNLQMINPLTGHDPYRGITWTYAMPHQPKEGPVLERMRQTILLNPPDWIVTHYRYVGGMTPLLNYLRLDKILPRYYAAEGYFGDYVLLKRMVPGPMTDL